MDMDTLRLPCNLLPENKDESYAQRFAHEPYGPESGKNCSFFFFHLLIFALIIYTSFHECVDVSMVIHVENKII